MPIKDLAPLAANNNAHVVRVQERQVSATLWFSAQ